MQELPRELKFLTGLVEVDLHNNGSLQDFREDWGEWKKLEVWRHADVCVRGTCKERTRVDGRGHRRR